LLILFVIPIGYVVLCHVIQGAELGKGDDTFEKPYSPCGIPALRETLWWIP